MKEEAAKSVQKQENYVEMLDFLKDSFDRWTALVFKKTPCHFQISTIPAQDSALRLINCAVADYAILRYTQQNGVLTINKFDVAVAEGISAVRQKIIDAQMPLRAYQEVLTTLMQNLGNSAARSTDTPTGTLTSSAKASEVKIIHTIICKKKVKDEMKR